MVSEPHFFDAVWELRGFVCIRDSMLLGAQQLRGAVHAGKSGWSTQTCDQPHEMHITDSDNVCCTFRSSLGCILARTAIHGNSIAMDEIART